MVQLMARRRTRKQYGDVNAGAVGVGVLLLGAVGAAAWYFLVKKPSLAEQAAKLPPLPEDHYPITYDDGSMLLADGTVVPPPTTTTTQVASNSTLSKIPAALVVQPSTPANSIFARKFSGVKNPFSPNGSW